MSPPKYTINRKIHSCFVDKDLIRSVEEYFYGLEDLKLSDKSNELEVEIEDSKGVEALTSIKQYSLHLFPNDVKEISISYRNYKIGVELSIRFNKEKMYSNFRLSKTGVNSRAWVNGVSSELDRILAEKKNWHYIYHPGLAGFTVSWTLFVGLALGNIALGFWRGNYVWVQNLLLIGLVLNWLYILILPRLFPYSTFDSNKNNNIKSVTKWLVLGTLGFIIFSIIAVKIWEGLGNKVISIGQ